MCWQLIGNIKHVKSYFKFTQSCTVTAFLRAINHCKVCSLYNKRFCPTYNLCELWHSISDLNLTDKPEMFKFTVSKINQLCASEILFINGLFLLFQTNQRTSS